MKDFFDTYIENAFGEFKQAEFKFVQFEFNYKRYLPTSKDAQLLDIGIGRGEMVTCFKRWGYKNYLGIDISSSCVNFCRSLGLNVLLVDSIVEFLNNKEDIYDVITMIDVLEHIPKEEVITILKTIKKALKKDGILIIQVPNLNSPEGFIHMFNDFTHFNGFNSHSLAQVLIAAGFSQFNFQPFETLLIYKNNWKEKIKLVIKKLLRHIYYRKVILERWITGNLSYSILTPILSCIIANREIE